eukprot:scaffold1850_cov131-Skeletonema_marinoi.AAC.6
MQQSRGCTNQAQRGGMCMRHGAYRNSHDESTAFGSGFDETATTTQFQPNQLASRPSIRRQGGRSVPDEVAILCQEIFEI